MNMSHAAEKKDAMEKPLTPMAPPLTPMAPPPLKLERNPSIDAEPKTLLRDELNMAREAALKILNTHTKEEALKIFLTGLVPVGTTSKQVKEDVVASDCDDE